MCFKLLIVGLIGFASLTVRAQAPDSILNTLSPRVTEKYISSISEKSDKISSALDKQTKKYLNRLQKEEVRINRKLSKIDSIAAKNIFTDSKKKYEDIKKDLENKSANLLKSSGHYFPFLDSATTSLKFLETNSPAFGKVSGNVTQVKAALGKVHDLEDEFKQAENVQEFIRQRKEYLKEQLANYNFGSFLKNYNQQAYYYAQQVNEYKAAMDDPSKLEKKALGILNQIPAFQDFMKKNSMLAGLFNIPEDYASMGVAGLQSRADVQQLIQSRISMMGASGSQTAQANMMDAQSQLSQLRNKFMQTGSGGEMPDFKPNDQKTKTFLKRLQYGMNVQTLHSTYYFPTTTDIGFSVGYKINDKNTIGFGGSTKIGWGTDYKHIAVTGQGLGIRSFMDLKIKGSFYASGGFEYNYQKVFSSFRQLPDIHTWQQSGLIGISKMVSIKSAVVKQTKLQLLWDFLSYYQIPRSQPIKFRIGYNF